MTRTKKWLFAVLAILLVGAACAGVLLHRSAQRIEQAQQAHALVYDRYCQMRALADSLTLTITEPAHADTLLTLDELGLRDWAYAQIDAQFTQTDRLTPEQFAALSSADQLAWLDTPQPQQRVVLFTDAQPDWSIADAALALSARTQPQDASFSCQEGQFLLTPEVYGDALDVDTVHALLAQALSAGTISEDSASIPDVTLSDAYYLTPAVTLEDLNVDFQTELTARLDAMTLRVSLRDGVTTLSSGTLHALVRVDEGGVISVDRERLASLAAAWGEQYNTYHTDFILDSYVDGVIPVSMLQCDYVLDEQTLCDELAAALLRLESGEVTANFRCLTEGTDEPFAIQDTYIEVDLTNQVMTYFKNGELIVTTDIVSGCNAVSATPRGLYFTSQMLRNTTLVGPTWSDFVEYWISFTPNNMLGLHDASWRDEFGGDIFLENGSHGCINTPTEAMKTIYENVEENTPVLVYHHARPGSNEPSL